MLRTHRFSIALLAAVLMAAGCATSQPVDTAEERPSAQEVAREASDGTQEAEVDDLVLYSNSVEEAEAGEADAEQGGHPGGTEAEQEPADDEPGVDDSADEEAEEDASESEEPADEPAEDAPEGQQPPTSQD